MTNAPAIAAAPADGTELCKQSIAQHSKSFALASRLFSRETSERAAIVYAWCRRADDAVDECAPEEQRVQLARLQNELDAVYGEGRLADPELEVFRHVVRDCALPQTYCEELLLGMRMDCEGTHYATLDQLLLYCHRVAGVVGLMMCHVMGLRDAAARRNAVHLGIAMQLTNICRDVLEDWERGRLYVPDDILDGCGAPELRTRLGGAFPRDAVSPMARAVHQLLELADDFYRSGDRGLSALPWRCAFAVRSARKIYAEIGREVEARGCDVTRGRAFTSKGKKMRLVARSLGTALLEAPVRLVRSFPTCPLSEHPPIRFPQDVLPLDKRAAR